MAAPVQREAVKATFLIYKNPALTDEEFRDHYINVHLPMALEVSQRHGVLSYTVQLTTETDRKETREVIGDAVEILDCDAVTTFVYRDRASLMAAFTDPDYEAKLAPDEARLTDRSKLRMTIGKEFVGL